MATATDTPSHFFKVILPQTRKDKNLRIPEKFARKFGDELSDVAMLRVPNGRVWHVGMTKDGSKILFNDGWHDFVEYHSICAGYFLVFKYGRNSNFDVLILDTTYCEIQYPCNGESNKQNEIKREDSVETMEDLRTPNPRSSALKKKDFRSCSKICPKPPSKQNQAKPSFQSAPVTNRGRKCAAASLESSPTHEYGMETRMMKKCKMEKLMEINESDVTAEKHGFALLEEMRIFVSRKFIGLSAEEKARMINVGESIKPKSPSFMVILRSKGIATRTVFVPYEFAIKYLGRDVKFVKLRVQGSVREWPVRICWRQCGGPLMRWYKRKNWDGLSKERKKLEDGDICLFEIIRKKDMLLKVSVFP
ncbi:hypothetical protein Dsin_026961 [Dipteronia sinensis]|uniref:TF-B3 domain-containing protein n=1 Tax=Dipteronia sinensis TaxID=43782 RepID=A0AAD9ZZ80_9ROSI|nr:hypothetical protein Dsin_026961 [Dipteronia sinensis]